MALMVKQAAQLAVRYGCGHITWKRFAGAYSRCWMLRTNRWVMCVQTVMVIILLFLDLLREPHRIGCKWWGVWILIDHGLGAVDR